MEVGSSLTGFIVLTIRIHREDEHYVAQCIELDVSSFGSTIDDALAMIRDAVHVHLNALEAEGEREREFAARGIAILPGSPDEGDTQVQIGVGEFVSREAMPLASVG